MASGIWLESNGVMPGGSTVSITAAAHQYDRCIETAEEALKLQPDGRNPNKFLGLAYMHQGRIAEAARHFQKLGAPVSVLTDKLAGASADELRRKLDAALPLEWKANEPFAVAELYALIGDKESAFVWLEKAFAQRQADLSFVKVEDSFDALHDDPRFADLLRRMGLAE